MNPKKLILLFGSVILFCSCKKDDTVVIFYTVASEQVYRYGAFGEVPYFVVKEKNDSDWKVLRDGIQGFDYERGYEYRVMVNKIHVREPMQDASSIEYHLLCVISKTLKDSENLPPIRWKYPRP